MKLQVSKEVLQQTTKCRNNFACLSSGQCGDEELCKGNYATGKNLLFLESDQIYDCPYRIPFGYSQVCTCPTHFAIYKLTSKF